MWCGTDVKMSDTIYLLVNWNNQHSVENLIRKKKLCQLLMPRVNYYIRIEFIVYSRPVLFYYNIDLYEDSSPNPLPVHIFYYTNTRVNILTNKNIDCCISNAGWKTSQLSISEESKIIPLFKLHPDKSKWYPFLKDQTLEKIFVLKTTAPCLKFIWNQNLRKTEI